MTDSREEMLKQWQSIGTKMLLDKGSSPSELETCAIALRRDDPKLSNLCYKESSKRKARWREITKL